MHPSIKRRNFVIIPIINALLVLVSSCGRPAATDGTVIAFVGDVMIAGASGAPRPAAVGETIKKGDTIRTGKLSQATIQVGSGILIKVLADGALKMEALRTTGDCEISLVRGRVLSLVGRLSKGSVFRVKTKTSTASVRGTIFMVACDENGASVAVAEGTVSVALSGTNETRDAGKGLAVDVGKTLTERPITELESLYLRKIQIEEIIPDPGKQKRSAIDDARKQVVARDREIDRQIEEFFPMSLPEIKKRYGRVDEVRFYDGSVIRGVILSRGATIIMNTPSGRISLPAVKVKYTGLAKGI